MTVAIYETGRSSNGSGTFAASFRAVRTGCDTSITSSGGEPNLFSAVCELDMEGVVAKRRDGIYTSDPHATTWWKVKNVDYSEARDRWELFERHAVNGRR